MKRLEGKAVLITGAASGIGLATTERLAREGARVLACDINAELLEKEVTALAGQGLEVTARALDVTDSADCNAAVAAAITRFGKLDVLCNSAGTLMIKNFTDFSDSDWAKVMNLNVNGVFAMCRAAMRTCSKAKATSSIFPHPRPLLVLPTMQLTAPARARC